MPEQSEFKKTLGGVFWGIIGLAFGGWMLIQPNVAWLEDEGPSGRKASALFDLLKAIWGLPGGIVLLLFGLLALFLTFKPKKPTTEAATED